MPPDKGCRNSGSVQASDEAISGRLLLDLTPQTTSFRRTALADVAERRIGVGTRPPFSASFIRGGVPCERPFQMTSGDADAREMERTRDSG